MRAREFLVGAGQLFAVGLALSFIVWAVWYAATAPREGIVVAAWLEPAHYETYQSGSVCISYDDKGSCTYSMPIFSQRWVSDRCWITVNDVEKTKRTATWPLDCAALPDVTIGDWRKL
jgi:hypothetical protein